MEEEGMNNSDQSRLPDQRGQANVSAPATLQCSEAEPLIMIRTCLELDRALHGAELECTFQHPIIVSLYAHGHRLGIGLGLRDSFVSFQRHKPTPGTNLITVGDARADDRAVFFFLGWRRTEIPRRNLLPSTKARQILREFFETGVRPAIVEWEAL
ncbi:MAG TPA: Imm1 family immunity protein [Verrucomicrobiae bacterium]|nr:Imm1 family immunity protein [Verrucomicrobiae bacterium]